MTNISVVVPVYNERKSIELFLNEIRPTLAVIGDYEIIFAVDPSTDGTQSLFLDELSDSDGNIKYLAFSRRVGQPMAVLAGILNCVGDCCVVIDVDLQDPPDLIAEMYSKFRDGYDVVYAKRRSRKGETLT